MLICGDFWIRAAPPEMALDRPGHAQKKRRRRRRWTKQPGTATAAASADDAGDHPRNPAVIGQVAAETEQMEAEQTETGQQEPTQELPHGAFKGVLRKGGSQKRSGRMLMWADKGLWKREAPCSRGIYNKNHKAWSRSASEKQRSWVNARDSGLVQFHVKPAEKMDRQPVQYKRTCENCGGQALLDVVDTVHVEDWQPARQNFRAPLCGGCRTKLFSHGALFLEPHGKRCWISYHRGM
jgi:hypothetical protein